MQLAFDPVRWDWTRHPVLRLTLLAVPTFRASVLTLYPDMFPGPLGSSLRWLVRLIRPAQSVEKLPTTGELARVRARTGYDILVPETFLGGKADSFVRLVHAYRAKLR